MEAAGVASMSVLRQTRHTTPRAAVHGARTIYAFECASCGGVWLEDVEGHTAATVAHIRDRLTLFADADSTG